MFFNNQGTQLAPATGGNQILTFSGTTQSANQINGVVADTWTPNLPEPKFWGAPGRQVLGGWQFNLAQTFQSGQPFTVTSGTDTNRDGTNNDRVNVVSDPYARQNACP
jgi:hypothetical protein